MVISFEVAQSREYIGMCPLVAGVEEEALTSLLLLVVVQKVRDCMSVKGDLILG